MVPVAATSIPQGLLAATLTIDGSKFSAPVPSASTVALQNGYYTLTSAVYLDAQSNGCNDFDMALGSIITVSGQQLVVRITNSDTSCNTLAPVGTYTVCMR